MKKELKHIIRTSMIMLMLLLITSVSSVLANDMILCNTVDSAKLRYSPSKEGGEVTTLPPGTLVYVTGSVVNEYDNVWFEVQYYGDSVYCYSEHLIEHTHDYSIPISDSNNYVCECGAIQNNGTTPVLFTEAVLGLAAEEALPYIAAEGAVLAYGVYKTSQYIIPIVFNKAGALVSITMDQLRSHSNDNSSYESGARVYYPAKIIAGDSFDSLEIIDFENGKNIDEACDYVDNVLRVNGAFGPFKNFTKTKISFCNIYTFNIENAEALCTKIIGCPANPINSYGSNNLSNIFEINSAKHLNGTYKHFHIFNTFDDKAVCHILFGDPLYYVEF